MAQEGGQGNHDGKHGNRHGEHGGNHGNGLGIQLQMHMATMTSHQNAFLEVVSLLCNTVSKLETTVLRNEADCTTRLDDLETSVKTLAFNIQGFSATQQQEEDERQARLIRAEKKLKSMKLGTGFSDYGSLAGTMTPAASIRTVSPRIPVEAPVPEEEKKIELEDETAVPAPVEAPPTPEQEVKVEPEAEITEPTPVADEPEPDPEPEPAPEPEPEPPKKRNEKARKRWKWAFKQVKFRNMARHVSMTAMRVQPHMSVGNRLKLLEDHLSSVNEDISSIKKHFGLDSSANGGGGLSGEIAALKDSLAALGISCNNHNKKLEQTMENFSILQKDFNASSTEIKNLKQDFNESSQQIEDIKQKSEGSEDEKKETIVSDIVRDLEILRLDVQNAVKEGDTENFELMNELDTDIEEALDEVRENPNSEESLSKVCRLSLRVQNVLHADDVELQRQQRGPSPETVEEGEEEEEEEEEERKEEEKKESSPRKKSEKLARKKTLAMIPVISPGDIVDSNVENSLRTKLENTNKRLANLMSAFSNVGKLELSVRALQEQMAKNLDISSRLQILSQDNRNAIMKKAAVDELSELKESKADLDFVNHMLKGYKSQLDEVTARTNPEFLTKAINDNVPAGMDELSANLQQHVQKFNMLKKEMGDKATTGEVTAALHGIQSSMQKFVNDSFSKDEIDSVLREKVDKKELKKLATALSGIGGPGQLTAGATRCLVCERPGMVQTKELIDAQHGRYDALDGYDNATGSNNIGYDLPNVRPPPNYNNMSGGRPSSGPESGGDNIDRYREEEMMMMDGDNISRHARMPPSSRMRTAVGGGGMNRSGGSSSRGKINLRLGR